MQSKSVWKPTNTDLKSEEPVKQKKAPKDDSKTAKSAEKLNQKKKDCLIF